MHDTVGMRVGESHSHLASNPDSFVDLERTIMNPLRQRRSLVERHHDERVPVLGLFDSVNDADVGMVERRCGACFTQEAFLVALARVQLAGRNFRATTRSSR